jgi:hypothetical protein
MSPSLNIWISNLQIFCLAPWSASILMLTQVGMLPLVQPCHLPSTTPSYYLLCPILIFLHLHYLSFWMAKTINMSHQRNHVFSFHTFFTSCKYKKSQYQKALPTWKKKSPLLFGLLSTCTLLFFFTCSSKIYFFLLVAKHLNHTFQTVLANAHESGSDMFHWVGKGGHHLSVQHHKWSGLEVSMVQKRP